MADNTPVNGQITDSITQSNVEVLGNSPAVAEGSLFQVFSSAIGISLQNAVSNQQNLNNISAAVTTKCVNLLLGKDQ